MKAHEAKAAATLKRAELRAQEKAASKDWVKNELAEAMALVTAEAAAGEFSAYYSCDPKKADALIKALKDDGYDAQVLGGIRGTSVYIRWENAKEE